LNRVSKHYFKFKQGSYKFFYLDGSQVTLKIRTSIKPPPPTYYYKNNYYKNTKTPFVIDEED
jgi:hypothetical protein